MRPSLRAVSRLALLALAAAASLTSVAHASWFDDTASKAEDAVKGVFERSRDEIPYCSQGQNCSLKAGSDIAASGVHDLVTDETASQFAQRVAGNVVAVLSVVAVLFIVYAGFLYLTSGGDDDKTKSAKSIIVSVVIGLAIVYFAWGIVSFVTQKILAPAPDQAAVPPQFGFVESLVPSAYADAGVPNQVTFDTYSEQILQLVPKLQNERDAGGISAASAQKLRDLVNKAAMTLPDSGVNIGNGALVTDVQGKIDQLLRSPGYESVEAELLKSLQDFLTNVKVPRVTAIIGAAPDHGNAPLVSTLSVRDVKDPSGAPVLNENIVWAVKTAGGGIQVVGRGPSISRKFLDQGTNAVFVAILSSSNNKAGYTDVLPYKNKVEIQVQERLASVYIYVNGNNVSDVDEVKLNPSDARSVILDATATTVPSGVSIAKTSWSFGNGTTKVYDGAPKIERQSYAAENSYPVWLRITTNRGDVVDKKFNVVVRDPIASIEVDKTDGMVGDEFKFKTRSTYANNGYAYVWEVRDPDTGNVIYSTNGLSATYVFRKSGKFSVRLRTISPDNTEDVDSKTINIDSREPIAKFSTKQASPETPDTWYFDASTSYDPDTAGGQLRDEWTVDGDPVRLANPVRDGAAGTYTFDSVGEHRVGLSVTNRDGKPSDSESTVKVASLLSVSLDVAPQIARRDQTVSFRATSRHAEVFEWDFGDGTKDVGSNGSETHSYGKSGTYNVALTVRNNTDASGPTSNVIRRSVYVTDSDVPFALIKATEDNDPVVATPDACGDGKDAFVVDRVSPIKFSAADSINVDGKPSGLSYFWKIGGDKTSTQRDLSYKFDDLGCVPVSLTVKSDATGKTSTSQSWAKVSNALPQLSNIDIQIPDLNSDPVVIKVAAQNAKDPDGAIVSYTWYYYTDNDSEPQGFRVTTVPTVTYVLPKVSGKYYFGVVMEDTNGEKANSEEVSDRRYSTPTLSSDSNLMTPIVKLAASTDSPLVGDEVKFTAAVRNAIGQDIGAKGDLEFKWDFDGDGFYDRQTTEPTASYSYGLPGQFAPKVKVSYKGVSTTQSVRVTVSNVLRPRLVPVAVGDKLVVFNTTSGFYKTAAWTADGAAASGNPGYLITTLSGGAPAGVGLTVSDGTQDKSEKADVPSGRRNGLLVRLAQDPLVVVSNKLVDANGGLEMSATGIEISDASDKLWIWLGASKVQADRYAIDTDTSLDSNLNGDPADDADNAGDASFTTGTPFQINLAAYKKRHVTLRFSLLGADGKAISKRDYALTLSYLPEDAPKDVTFDNVSDADRAHLEKIKGLVQQAPEGDRLYLMKSLAQLKDLWDDKVGKTETIIAMEDYVNSSAMPDAAKKDLFSTLDGLVAGDSQVADDVTLAANVVKNLIPTNSPAYAPVVVGDKAANEAGLVDQILAHPNDAAQNKELGKKVLDLIKDDDTISVENKLTIKEQLRVIIAGGTANLPAPEPVVAVAPDESAGFLHTLAVVGKWLVIVLLGVLGVVVVAGLVLKATNKNANTGFADGLIDLFGNKGGTGPTTGPKPAAPTPAPQAAKPAPAPVPAPKPAAAPAPAFAAPAPKKEDVPDWLKAATGATPSAPAATPAPAPKKEDVPDWLKAATAPVVPVTPASAAPAPKKEDVPDWLKAPSVTPAVPAAPAATPVIPAPVSAPKPAANDVPDWLKPAAAPADAPAPAPKAETRPAPQKDELPDWLKAPAVTPAAPTPAVPSPVSTPKPAPAVVAPAAKPVPAPSAKKDELPDWLKAPAVTPAASATPSPAPKAEAKPAVPAPASAQSADVDDLPDWLKAPVVPVVPVPAPEPSADEPEEASAQASTAVYERTPDGKIVKKPVAKKKTSAKKEAKPEPEEKPKKPAPKKAA